MSEPFIGEIRMFGFNFPPRNWVTCSGQLLPISQNPTLYALINGYYGGDGRTTMGVPDLRGRAPISSGQAPGLSYYTLGERGGSELTYLNDTQIPSHSHTATPNLESLTPAANSTGNEGSPGGNVPAEYTMQGARSPANFYSNAADTNLKAGTVTGTIAIGDNGGGQPHNNRPPYIALNFCMAIAGLFPPRN